MRKNNKPIFVNENTLTNRQFDLDVRNLEELARLIGVAKDSPEFEEYLTEANKLSWVEAAPKDIRDAIRARQVK